MAPVQRLEAHDRAALEQEGEHRREHPPVHARAVDARERYRAGQLLGARPDERGAPHEQPLVRHAEHHLRSRDWEAGAVRVPYPARVRMPLRDRRSIQRVDRFVGERRLDPRAEPDGQRIDQVLVVVQSVGAVASIGRGRQIRSMQRARTEPAAAAHRHQRQRRVAAFQLVQRGRDEAARRSRRPDVRARSHRRWGSPVPCRRRARAATRARPTRTPR